ncbi:MAG: hypothetical protein HND48_00905 [Chloroflexi bacterium]|nr:hypothetical protein [Chloroflexota bacterium]
MALEHRLPQRIRDFIREHHGTSLVKVFYQQAVIAAGDDASKVDIRNFRYPGPRPQTKETGIMLLADSCEAALRSTDPQSRSDIKAQVTKIINGYRDGGQLDDSGLTLKDIKQIERIFVDMIEATLHPRINYDAVISKARRTQSMRAVVPAEAAQWTPDNRGPSTGGLDVPAQQDDEEFGDDHARALGLRSKTRATTRSTPIG